MYLIFVAEDVDNQVADVGVVVDDQQPGPLGIAGGGVAVGPLAGGGRAGVDPCQLGVDVILRYQFGRDLQVSDICLTGMVTVKTEPLPTSLSAVMVPW